MILALLLVANLPWSAEDEATLGPVRAAFGFSEGMRALDLGQTPAEWRDSSYCGSCHQEAYEEWSRSLHAGAASDPLFLAGFREDPDLRCARCHAPLAEDQGPFRRALRSKQLLSPALREAPVIKQRTGIGCAVCHVRDGKVLTARPISTAEHATRYEPRLSSSEFCGSCHQFRFERGHGKGATLSENVVQDTWREHRRSQTEKRCQDCHRQHAYPGAHDPELLRRSLAVSTRARTPERQQLELRSVDVGHQLPTGDLFRHLRVEVERDGKYELVATIGRSFEVITGPGEPTKRLVEDRSLSPGETRTIEVQAKAGQRWRVVYRYTSAANPPSQAQTNQLIADGLFELSQ